MPLSTRGKSPGRRWRFGVVPKILALVLVPIVILAGLNAYTLGSSTARLDGALTEASQRQRVTIALDDAVARVKDDIIGLQQTLAVLISVHQRSLLRGEETLAARTREQRRALAAALDGFAANVTALANRIERSQILRTEGVPQSMRRDAGRRLAYLERSRTTLARMLSLFESANARTLEALEAGHSKRAADNFIFEERARLNAMRDRLARSADMAVSLGEHLRTIQAERTRIERAAADRAAEQATLYQAGILAAAIVLVMAAAATIATYGFARPLKGMVDVMLAFADERTERPIPPPRNDEIGDMSRALVVFRKRTQESREMREALHAAKEKAEEANQAKSRFLSTMSHELRTPLNAVIGFADVIRSRMFGDSTQTYAGYADDIYNSGRHLLDLVNDLLDLSRLEAGRYDLTPAWIDVTAIATTCLTMLETRAQEKGVALHRELPPEVPVWADERAMRQVLLNLLTNAVKFTDAGGVVRVAVDTEREGRLHIRVSDSGAGIAPEDIDRVLQPLHQADARTSRDTEEGSGLGLAISRELVELHGGTLRLDSALGAGTTVTIELPRDGLASAAADTATSRPAAAE